jgi:hypothetical protein
MLYPGAVVAWQTICCAQPDNGMIAAITVMNLRMVGYLRDERGCPGDVRDTLLRSLELSTS